LEKVHKITAGQAVVTVLITLPIFGIMAAVVSVPAFGIRF